MRAGNYEEAARFYQRATQLAPAFSFAAANRTLALYQAGQTNEAMREMRCARTGSHVPAANGMAAAAAQQGICCMPGGMETRLKTSGRLCWCRGGS